MDQSIHLLLYESIPNEQHQQLHFLELHSDSRNLVQCMHHSDQSLPGELPDGQHY
jgi:hypothetical protein